MAPRDRLKFSVKETDRVNNSLIAITPYKFEKLVEINGDEGIVRIIETTPYGQAIRPNLPWHLVGVFGFVKVTEEKERVNLKDIFGKIVICNDVLITALKNILHDK